MKLKLILKIILICSIVFYFGCTEKKSSVLLPIYGEKKNNFWRYYLSSNCQL